MDKTKKIEKLLEILVSDVDFNNLVRKGSTLIGDSEIFFCPKSNEAVFYKIWNSENGTSTYSLSCNSVFFKFVFNFITDKEFIEWFNNKYGTKINENIVNLF